MKNLGFKLRVHDYNQYGKQPSKIHPDLTEGGLYFKSLKRLHNIGIYVDIETGSRRIRKETG